jgi:hypothetical protein
MLNVLMESFFSLFRGSHGFIPGSKLPALLLAIVLLLILKIAEARM